MWRKWENSYVYQVKQLSSGMPWLSVTGICMQSCSQSTEMISIIECKLVIAAFFLNQLREVKHQTEKYCKFKTRTHFLLQTIPNKFCAYSCTLFWSVLGCFTVFVYMIQCCCQIVLSKLQSAYEWIYFCFPPFPHLTTFIASPGMSTQCLRKYFWIWLEKCYSALNISEYLVHYSVAWNIQVLAFQCCIFCLSSLLLGYDSNVPLPVNTPKYSIQTCKIPNF